MMEDSDAAFYRREVQRLQGDIRDRDALLVATLKDCERREMELRQTLRSTACAWQEQLVQDAAKRVKNVERSHAHDQQRSAVRSAECDHRRDLEYTSDLQWAALVHSFCVQIQGCATAALERKLKVWKFDEAALRRQLADLREELVELRCGHSAEIFAFRTEVARHEESTLLMAEQAERNDIVSEACSSLLALYADHKPSVGGAAAPTKAEPSIELRLVESALADDAVSNFQSDQHFHSDQDVGRDKTPVEFALVEREFEEMQLILRETLAQASLESPLLSSLALRSLTELFESRLAFGEATLRAEFADAQLAVCRVKRTELLRELSDHGSAIGQLSDELSVAFAIQRNHLVQLASNEKALLALSVRSELDLEFAIAVAAPVRVERAVAATTASMIEAFERERLAVKRERDQQRALAAMEVVFADEACVRSDLMLHAGCEDVLPLWASFAHAVIRTACDDSALRSADCDRLREERDALLESLALERTGRESIELELATALGDLKSLERDLVVATNERDLLGAEIVDLRRQNLVDAERRFVGPSPLTNSPDTIADGLL